MARFQSKEEKKRFFDHLDSLDCSNSDSDLEPILTQYSPRKKLKISPRVVVKSAYDVQPSSNNHLRFENNNTSHQHLALVSAEKSTHYTSDLANASEHIHGDSVKRKGKVVERGDSTREQLFHGFVFYFIPNSDVSKPRKLRIQSAVAHGATWSRVIDEKVTHIIVDSMIEHKDATKSLQDKNFRRVVMIKDNWLTESLGHKVLKDLNLRRFRLKGTPDSISNIITNNGNDHSSSKAPSPAQNAIYKNYEHGLPTAEAMPHNARKVTSKNGPDMSFSTIIREVQASTSGLPLDEDLDEMRNFLSETEADTDESHVRRRRTSQSTFRCMQDPDISRETSNGNPNARTIEILSKLCDHYTATSDQWRSLAYRRAIAALRQTNTRISTRQEALAINGIGVRLADKIEEIVTTDRLRRLEALQDDPDDQVLKLFMGIYGVGLKQARQWLAAGFRTLEDLLAADRAWKLTLTENHKIGIAHYSDFAQRIPRAEVKQHGVIVRGAVQAVDPEMQVIIMGSYRRGSSDSGDIDLIITRQTKDISIDAIHSLMLNKVIPGLMKQGYLKAALARSSQASRQNDSGSKWHGACALPVSHPATRSASRAAHTESPWRRIDFLFVPTSSLGAALLYFTGDDIFNRSIRFLASRKGMRLNQHGLYADVMRGSGSVKLNEGRLIEGRDERKIFELLGVPWKEPTQRKCA